MVEAVELCIPAPYCDMQQARQSPMSTKRGGGSGGERQSRATGKKKHSGGSTLATEAGLREGTFWGVEKFDGQLGKACLACLPTAGLTRFYL